MLEQTRSSFLFVFMLLAFLLSTGCDDDPSVDAGLDGDVPDSSSDGSPDSSSDSSPDGSDSSPDDAGGDAGDSGVNSPPTASFAATPLGGSAPLTVSFDARGSTDPDGTIVSYGWQFGDGSSGEGQMVEHTFAEAGCFDVVLTVTDDDEATGTATETVVVVDAIPSGDPEVVFDERPLQDSLVPRDLETNFGFAAFSGRVVSPGYDHVLIRDSSESGVFDTVQVPLCPEASELPFDLSAPIEAALESHDLEVYLVAGDEEVLVETVTNVVAGDVIIVQGQSNAVAGQYDGDANVNKGPFLRSFGTNSEDQAQTEGDLLWHEAEGNRGSGAGGVGQWALRMGRMLIDEQGIPLAIVNGARGGMPIDYFQRNDEDTTDLSTNYGRLLYRMRAARLDFAVRTILFYQGESDGNDATAHHDGWIALREDWLEDYPTVEMNYVTQVQVGCGGSPQVREVQRKFADDLPAVAVMSTTGLDGHDGCHFAYVEGYEELGVRYGRLLGRDLYGAADAPDIDAPNPERAYFSSDDGSEITVAMRDTDSTLAWDSGAEGGYALEGVGIVVTAGRAEGSNLILSLSGDGRGATGLTYVGHSMAGPWVTNANGVGLLAFHILPIDAE